MAGKVTKIKKGEGATKYEPPKPASYLKLDNKFYALMETDAIVDIEKELKEYHQEEFEKAIKGSVSNFIGNVDDDWNTSLTKLNNFKNKHRVSIPDTMLNKCVRYNNSAGVLMEVRPAIYCPQEILTSKSYVIADTAELPERDERVKEDDEMWGDISRNAEITVIVKNEIRIPVMVGISVERNRVVVYGCRTFHSSGLDSHMCIGNHNAKDYYKLDTESLSREISKANRFSPYTSTVTDESGNRLYDWASLQKRSNIIRIEREVRAWTT